MKPLIYDVGMYNGDDSAYYLKCGYRVVAIEANPELVPDATSRFESEISAGDMTILNVAMADVPGLRKFWVCDSTPEFSSFDQSIAGRNDGQAHSIMVTTARFRDLLAQHGVPEYLKIDIEGSDLTCIRDLNANSLPLNVSVESECGGSEVMLQPSEYIATLHMLYEKGYRRFKLVNQHTLIPVYPGRCNLEMFSRENVARFRAGLDARCAWHFPHGSSGPWGDHVEGPWMTLDEAEEIYYVCREAFFSTIKGPLYGFWFDWHAAL
jgi:FkbM family methyltransferase